MSVPLGRTMQYGSVIADASYCKKTGAAGWGVWVTLPYSTGLVRRFKRSGHLKTLAKSSTDAEMLAALTGLWYAVSLGGTHLLLQTDCEFVLQSLKNPTARYARMLSMLDPYPVIYTRRVKGHVQGRPTPAEYAHNWCDAAAKRRMRYERSKLYTTSGDQAAERYASAADNASRAVGGSPALGNANGG